VFRPGHRLCIAGNIVYRWLQHFRLQNHPNNRVFCWMAIWPLGCHLPGVRPGGLHDRFGEYHDSDSNHAVRARRRLGVPLVALALGVSGDAAGGRAPGRSATGIGTRDGRPNASICRAPVAGKTRGYAARSDRPSRGALQKTGPTTPRRNGHRLQAAQRDSPTHASGGNNENDPPRRNWEKSERTEICSR
jgi:hypothetical protein